MYNFIKRRTLRGSIIQHKQGIQLYPGGCFDTK